MRGHRLTVIALSLIITGACGSNNALTLDGGIDDGPVAADKGMQDQVINADARNPSSPKWKWAVSAGAVSSGEHLDDSASDISTDSAGNSYITGRFHNTATFGSTTLTSKGLDDIFVAKLDSAGKFVWVVSAGGVSYDCGYDISTDSAGNSYVTGRFSGTVTFGNTTLTTSGRRKHVFVAKLDSVGKFVWAVSAGGLAYHDGYSIAVDSSGNSYVTGRFSGVASFGSTTLTSNGTYDLFVAKLDRGGKFVWAVSAGGTWGIDAGTSIAVDSSGHIYVTGYLQDTTTFGSTTLTQKGAVTVFVAKLDSGGEFIWAVSAECLYFAMGYSIALDGLGNSYVTGSFVGTATFGDTPLVSSEGLLNSFVAKLDSSGKFVWVVPAGAGSASGISMDSSGNSYVTGDFKGTATFGSTTLTSKGSRDIFVAKLGSGGKFVWAVSGGGILDDYGGSIDVDSAGNSYVVGIFEGTATLGSTTLTSKGGFDIFVAKLDSGGKP
jgi:Beta-propeller repeat